MHNITTGISAGEVMNRDFPILDSSLKLINCIKRMNNKHEACLIIKNGNFFGILGYDDILRGFIYGKDREAKIEKLQIKKRFAVVKPDADIFTTLLLMKRENIDFILVKDKNNFLGIITKKEIADIEPELFDNVRKVNYII